MAEECGLGYGAPSQGGTATKMILEVIFALAASQALKLSVLGGPPVPERPRGALREDMEVKEATPLPFLGGLLDGIIKDRIDRAYDPSAQVVNRKFTEFSGLCTEMLLAYEATVQVRLSPTTGLSPSHSVPSHQRPSAPGCPSNVCSHRGSCTIPGLRARIALSEDPLAREVASQTDVRYPISWQITYPNHASQLLGHMSIYTALSAPWQRIALSRVHEPAAARARTCTGGVQVAHPRATGASAGDHQSWALRVVRGLRWYGHGGNDRRLRAGESDRRPDANTQRQPCHVLARRNPNPTQQDSRLQPSGHSSSLTPSVSHRALWWYPLPQVPTFGARDKDVRGFISGGWEAMGLYSALGQLTAASGLPAVSTDYFIEQVLPSSNTSDLVILVHSVNGPPPLPTTDNIQSVIAAKKRRGFQVSELSLSLSLSQHTHTHTHTHKHTRRSLTSLSTLPSVFSRWRRWRCGRVRTWTPTAPAHARTSRQTRTIRGC